MLNSPTQENVLGSETGRSRAGTERKHITIAKDPTRHLAFPDVCQARSGEMYVVYRDGQQHVDQSGRVMVVQGSGFAEQWEFGQPMVVCDTDLDDRDPSIVELSNGSLLINFFRLNIATKELKLSLTQSWDKGETWSEPWDVHVPGFTNTLAVSDAIVELPSGECLMAVYGVSNSGESGSFVLRSQDTGKTWLDVIPLAVADAPIYEEPALVYRENGQLVTLLRTDNRGLGYVYQTTSFDDGYTWSQPERLDLWGYPSDLLALANGELLATYGYRQLPTGIRYCLAKGPNHWSIRQERILRSDGHDWGELGYPSSVELGGGEVVTVYYFTDPCGGMPYIAGTFFRYES
jgi:hypothetical protein